MKKKLIVKYTLIVIFLFLGVLFVAKVAGSSILRLYIETGIGNCRKIPILCIVPTQNLNAIPLEDKEFSSGLVPYDFPTLDIYLPKGFAAVNEEIKKVYYKKRKGGRDSVVYLLTEKPGFFVGLFPEVRKQKVNNDYEFYTRVMNARLNSVNKLSDAFFVIIKSIFTPNMGNQSTVKMANLFMPDSKGFISYNYGKDYNYYDCNMFDNEGNFFKIYIKDKGAKLSLDNVFTIISTARVKY